MVTPQILWAACSNTWTPFQWRSFSIYPILTSPGTTWSHVLLSRCWLPGRRNRPPDGWEGRIKCLHWQSRVLPLPGNEGILDCTADCTALCHRWLTLAALCYLGDNLQGGISKCSGKLEVQARRRGFCCWNTGVCCQFCCSIFETYARY